MARLTFTLPLLVLLTACGTSSPPPPVATPSRGPATPCDERPDSPECLEYLKGPADPIDRARRIARACDAGGTRACALIVASLEHREAPLTECQPREPTPAPKGGPQASLPEADEPGDESESVNAEREAAIGARLLEDPSPKRLAAPDHLFKACRARSARACNDLGWVYDHGFGAVSKDKRRAQELFEKSCELGSTLGCFNRGRLARRTNTGDAALFLDKACSRGFSDACEQLAGVVQQTRANCRRHNGGCTNWGFILENGLGVPSDLKAALRAYEKACTGGSANGCGNAAQFHAEGRGTPVSRTQAVVLFDAACKRKSDWGCLRATQLRAKQ